MNPKELAAAVLKQITEHPETHDQETWFENPGIYSRDIVEDAVLNVTCESTACVAGWTVVLAYEDEPLDAARAQNYIGSEAESLLALTYKEAQWLFSTVRSTNEVTNALQRIVAGEPVLPS